jgi:hypothetical protein
MVLHFVTRIYITTYYIFKHICVDDAGACMVGIARELDMTYAAAAGESSGLLSEEDEARLRSLLNTDMMRAVVEVAARVAAVATASLVFKIAFGPGSIGIGPQIVKVGDVSS